MERDSRIKAPCPFCGSDGAASAINRKADEYVATVSCLSNDCEAIGPARVGTTRGDAITAAVEAWERRFTVSRVW